MSEKVTTLTPRQRNAIQALIEGKKISQVAQIVGVSRKTLYVWLDQPAFRAELDRLGNFVLEDIAQRMVDLSSEAVETLAKILHTANVPIPNQIQAANVILQRSVELWELYKMNRQVEAINAVLDTSDK